MQGRRQVLVRRAMRSDDQQTTLAQPAHQMHKHLERRGIGPVQIVQDDVRDVAILGQAYSFSILKQAQALGDFESLRSRALPVVRVNLGSRIDPGWKALAEAVEAALR